MTCTFRLVLYATGNLTMECFVPFTTDFAKVGSKQIGPNYSGLISASFCGRTSDGGTVHIDDMAVNDFNLIEWGTLNINYPKSKFVVDLDSLDPNSKSYLRQIWQMKGYDPKSLPTKGKRKLLGHIIFLIIKEVTIHFRSANQNDIVRESWGIANLQYEGCERGVAGRLYPDSFKVNIHSHAFTFSHADYYQQKIKLLAEFAGVDMTTNVTTEAKVSELTQVESILEIVCYLLSLATMNWVTRLFKDVRKGRELLCTTLLPYFTLPFKRGYNVINIKDGSNCQLKRFVETAFENYRERNNDFPLNHIIEYYISAARAHSPENQFAIAYLALDCLASNVPKYAEKVDGVKLENAAAVTAKENTIDKILKDQHQTLPTNIVHTIADAVAYKEVGDKMKIQYLINKFGVEFGEKTLGDIVSFRGRFMHTGMDRKMESWQHYQNVLGILERMLLTMLGWGGNQYVDRLSGYSLKTLK